mmetsp:Transcript_118146/g.294659  ORF Transcript_118146/g.294659 Transcript_118146/m.294659 type:complete len:312 (+) Transcript_118146:1045-1980(+)
MAPQQGQLRRATFKDAPAKGHLSDSHLAAQLHAQASKGEVTNRRQRGQHSLVFEIQGLALQLDNAAKGLVIRPTAISLPLLGNCDAAGKIINLLAQRADQVVPEDVGLANRLANPRHLCRPRRIWAEDDTIAIHIFPVVDVAFEPAIKTSRANPKCLQHRAWLWNGCRLRSEECLEVMRLLAWPAAVVCVRTASVEIRVARAQLRGPDDFHSVRIGGTVLVLIHASALLRRRLLSGPIVWLVLRLLVRGLCLCHTNGLGVLLLRCRLDRHEELWLDRGLTPGHGLLDAPLLGLLFRLSLPFCCCGSCWITL